MDSVGMQLVMEPENFDVLVTTNMFGDILSDVAAGVVGGLGLRAVTKFWGKVWHGSGCPRERS